VRLVRREEDSGASEVLLVVQRSLRAEIDEGAWSCL
jgi:hypothetical protein